MKKLLKKYLPKGVLKIVIQFYNRFTLSSLYRRDKKRYLKYGYEINTQKYSFDNLRSKISFHAHAIEKGLSNNSVRLGFGKSAFENLFFALDEYLKNEYDFKDLRFQQALKVIYDYIIYHQQHDYEISWIENKFEESYSHLFNHNVDGGLKIIEHIDSNNFSTYDFEDLVHSRVSVRNFGSDNLDVQAVKNALSLAIDTPSACNRQPWKVYHTHGKTLVDKVRSIQHGLTTHGENLNDMLLITSNTAFYRGPHERNQAYVDGGIFAMNLVNSLTYYGVASCMLHADFMSKQEDNMRALLNVPENEVFICFVAIGTFPSEIKTAVSPKDKIENFYNLIEA